MQEFENKTKITLNHSLSSKFDESHRKFKYKIIALRLPKHRERLQNRFVGNSVLGMSCSLCDIVMSRYCLSEDRMQI